MTRSAIFAWLFAASLFFARFAQAQRPYNLGDSADNEMSGKRIQLNMQWICDVFDVNASGYERPLQRDVDDDANVDSALSALTSAAHADFPCEIINTGDHNPMPGSSTPPPTPTPSIQPITRRCLTPICFWRTDARCLNDDLCFTIRRSSTGTQ